MAGCADCEWNPIPNDPPDWCSLVDEQQSTSGTCPGYWDANEAHTLAVADPDAYWTEHARRCHLRHEVYASKEYAT